MGRVLSSSTLTEDHPICIRFFPASVTVAVLGHWIHTIPDSFRVCPIFSDRISSNLHFPSDDTASLISSIEIHPFRGALFRRGC